MTRTLVATPDPEPRQTPRIHVSGPGCPATSTNGNTAVIILTPARSTP